MNISNSFEQLVSPITIDEQQQCQHSGYDASTPPLSLPGSTPSHPAASCREIKELSPTAPSGYYWLRGTGDSSVHMYCDMSRSCGGITGGWMPVTKIDMRNTTYTSDSRPHVLKTLTQPGYVGRSQQKLK